MDRTEIRKAYAFSIKGTVAKITLAMAILSSVRFFVDVYQLPLGQLLANVLKTYQVVFHTCVDVLFIWLPYKLPPWAKDLLIFYSVFAFIYIRVILVLARVNYHNRDVIEFGYRNIRAICVLHVGLQLIKAIFLWPIQLPRLIRSPYLASTYPTDPLMSRSLSPMYFLERLPPEGVGLGVYYGDARLIMLIRLASIIFGAAVVLMFNYAFSI